MSRSNTYHSSGPVGESAPQHGASSCGQARKLKCVCPRRNRTPTSRSPWTCADPARYGGRELLERHGRWLHVTPDSLDRADKWFEKWDRPGVLIGAMTPLVRSFVAIPAGVFEMPFVPFAVLIAIGGTIWSFAFTGIGYAAGASYDRVDHGFRFVEYAIVACVVVLAVYLVFRWRTKAKVESNADDPAR